MRISSVLKLLTLAGVLAGGGVALKIQHDEIDDLRQNNNTLVKKFDDNESAVARWKDEQAKEFKNSLDKMKKDIEGQGTSFEERAKQLEGAQEGLVDRVSTLEVSNEDLANKLGAFENSSTKLDGRITKLEKTSITKTDEEIRTAMVQKALPSVVDIVAHIPGGQALLTGSVIDDRKGNLAILTAGHFIKSSDDFLKTKFQINFKNGFVFEINGHKMSNGMVPWSSVDHRDYSIIRLTDEMQALLKKHGVKPIPIMTASKQPTQGGGLIAIGREGKVLQGTFNRTNYYQWLGRWRTDYQTDAAIKKGDSGGPVLNLTGEITGIASWGYKPGITLTGPKEIVGKLKVDVEALTGVHYFVSNKDLFRGMGSAGYPLTAEERNHLLKIDVLDDRPHLLAPPIVGQGLSPSLLTYLGQLSELDGYAFQK